MRLVEPWLRGPLDGVSPFVAPLLRSFEMAREDLAQHTEGLTTEQLWERPAGAAPVGFHIRHIGGSVERLIVYLRGRLLDDRQMKELRAEMEPGATREQLLAELDRALSNAEAVVRSLPLESLTEPRGVGRKALPTTVIGLIIHIAEHTQRHTGQAVTTARLVRAQSTPPEDPRA
jgi:hypothetical protein